MILLSDYQYVKIKYLFLLTISKKMSNFAVQKL